MMDRLRYYLKGIRFYIAVGSLLITILTVVWAHAAYGGTTLYAARVEEVFAWLATGLIVLAMGIGPVCKLFPRLPGKRLLFDARRLIGVSATWFAALHVLISYASLFKFANPLSLPSLYQRSFLAGMLAIIILLAMAFTSFDAAFNGLGKWWFRLHRLVYAAILLVLLHAFLTGVHASQPVVIGLIAIVGVVFMTMYGVILSRTKTASLLQTMTVVSVAVLFVGIVGFGIDQHHTQTRMENYQGVQR